MLGARLCDVFSAATYTHIYSPAHIHIQRRVGLQQELTKQRVEAARLRKEIETVDREICIHKRRQRLVDVHRYVCACLMWLCWVVPAGMDMSITHTAQSSQRGSPCPLPRTCLRCTQAFFPTHLLGKHSTPHQAS